MFSRVLIVLAISLSYPLIPAQANNTWSGSAYSKNKSVQFLGAVDQIDRYVFTGKEVILDLGSGDGEITALLASKTKGQVEGLDLNESMVEFAKKTFIKPNLKFVHADASQINYQNRFDLVTSFNTIQWIENQQDLLNRVYSSLKKKGKILFGIPTILEEEKIGTSLMVRIIRELITSERWKDQFKTFKSSWHFSSASQFNDMLVRSKFKSVRVTVSIKPFKMPNESAFKSWMNQILPHLRYLNPSEREEFLNSILKRYLDQVSLSESGEVVLSHAQLEVFAEK